MSKTVIIFGGGISGLTVAHELLDRGYSVTLIEKDNILGGMAKSRRESNGVPSEHSWRGYAPFYKNTFELLRRIPLKEDGKTVYDNLSLPVKFHLLSDTKDETIRPDMTYGDYAILGYYGLKYLTANNRKKEYYSTKLIPVIKNKLSDNGKDVIIEFAIGPGFGMEKKDASLGHVFRFLTLSRVTSQDYTHVHQHPEGDYIHYGVSDWHVTTKPTHEAWFEPWKIYLVKKGLKILKNTELIRFNLKNDSIESCVIKHNNLTQTLRADTYALCINPFNTIDVLDQSGLLTLRDQYIMLTKNTDSRQISFRLGFLKKIKFPSLDMAFVMTDSEYNITWYPQEDHWDSDVKLDSESNIKSLWSGTILQSYARSKIYGNKAIHLTKSELIDDIIYQILRSKSLQKIIYENNGFYLSEDDVAHREIWFEWIKEGNELIQSNKKWVNNIYNEEHRPKQKTNINNLFLGGAHTQTTINIWSMEGAVESGKIVASLIDANNKDSKEVVKYDHSDPFYINFFQTIDDFLYAIYLPNIIDLLILISVVVLIIYIINYNLKD